MSTNMTAHNREFQFLGTVTAMDENDRTFVKDVRVRPDRDGNALLAIGSATYFVDDLIRGTGEAFNRLPPRFYIDLGGRNHLGSPVFISLFDLVDLLRKAVERIAFHPDLHYRTTPTVEDWRRFTEVSYALAGDPLRRIAPPYAEQVVIEKVYETDEHEFDIRHDKAMAEAITEAQQIIWALVTTWGFHKTYKVHIASEVGIVRLVLLIVNSEDALVTEPSYTSLPKWRVGQAIVDWVKEE